MFTLSIHTGNDAFLAAPELAISEILRKVVRQLEEGTTHGDLRDTNGNTVGCFKLHCGRDLAFLVVRRLDEGVDGERMPGRKLRKWGGNKVAAWVDMCETIGQAGECFEDPGEFVAVFLGRDF